MEAERGNKLGGAGTGFSLDEPALLGAAANELNAPLVLLRQLSLALADDSLSADERRRLTERLRLTSERALRLTRQLGFNPDAPQLITLEPINPVSLCQEVVHELSPLFSAHGRAITLRPRSKIPLLIADRSMLRRVLLGFGDNALHYGSNEQPVQVTIAASGGRVRIGVRDYGPAVPSDVWRKLDGRVARRTGVALANRPQTSGVGLVVARQLAERMGGAIGATRHRDGATFYIDMHASGQMSLL